MLLGGTVFEEKIRQFCLDDHMEKVNRLNLVEEFRKKYIKEKLPDCLYHYTSIENFKSIIDMEEIWATAANCFISDPTEITIAKSIALDVLQKRKIDFSGKDKLYDNCKKDIEGSDSFKEYQFICSFTEEGDLLSQWRGYCPKGGVSIGFSVPKISENDQYLYNKNGCPHDNYYVHENYLYKCIYEIQEKKQKINALISFLLEKTDINIPMVQLETFFKNMIRTFSYSFKHESFKEEKEWRLCYFIFPDPDDPDGGQIKYKVKDSMLIPYRPFLTVDKDKSSIIKSVKIGPSRDKENLKTSISSYLTNLEYRPGQDISVSVTQTPYQNLQ